MLTAGDYEFLEKKFHQKGDFIDPRKSLDTVDNSVLDSLEDTDLTSGRKAT